MLKWLHAYVLSCETLIPTSHVQSVTCLHNMLEVCFSCESKIIAQVRSATVVLQETMLWGAQLQNTDLKMAKLQGANFYKANL